MILKALLAVALSAAFIYLILFVWFAATLGSHDFGAAADMARLQARRGLLDYAVPFGWLAIMAFDMLSVLFFRLGLDDENKEIELRQDLPLGRVLTGRMKWLVFYPVVTAILIFMILLATRS
jgi:hypothetical protein